MQKKIGPKPNIYQIVNVRTRLPPNLIDFLNAANKIDEISNKIRDKVDKIESFLSDDSFSYTCLTLIANAYASYRVGELDVDDIDAHYVNICKKRFPEDQKIYQENEVFQQLAFRAELMADEAISETISETTAKANIARHIQHTVQSKKRFFNEPLTLEQVDTLGRVDGISKIEAIIQNSLKEMRDNNPASENASHNVELLATAYMHYLLREISKQQLVQSYETIAKRTSGGHAGDMDFLRQAQAAETIVENAIADILPGYNTPRFGNRRMSR